MTSGFKIPKSNYQYILTFLLINNASAYASDTWNFYIDKNYKMVNWLSIFLDLALKICWNYYKGINWYSFKKCLDWHFKKVTVGKCILSILFLSSSVFKFCSKAIMKTYKVGRKVVINKYSFSKVLNHWPHPWLTSSQILFLFIDILHQIIRWCYNIINCDWLVNQESAWK